MSNSYWTSLDEEPTPASDRSLQPPDRSGSPRIGKSVSFKFSPPEEIYSVEDSPLDESSSSIPMEGHTALEECRAEEKPEANSAWNAHLPAFGQIGAKIVSPPSRDVKVDDLAIPSDTGCPPTRMPDEFFVSTKILGYGATDGNSPIRHVSWNGNDPEESESHEDPATLSPRQISFDRPSSMQMSSLEEGSMEEGYSARRASISTIYADAHLDLLFRATQSEQTSRTPSGFRIRDLDLDSSRGTERTIDEEYPPASMGMNDTKSYGAPSQTTILSLGISTSLDHESWATLTYSSQDPSSLGDSNSEELGEDDWKDEPVRMASPVCDDSTSSSPRMSPRPSTPSTIGSRRAELDSLLMEESIAEYKQDQKRPAGPSRTLHSHRSDPGIDADQEDSEHGAIRAFVPPPAQPPTEEGLLDGLTGGLLDWFAGETDLEEREEARLQPSEPFFAVKALDVLGGLISNGLNALVEDDDDGISHEFDDLGGSMA